MEVEQLQYQGTLAATPRAQLEVAIHPGGIAETGDRDWQLVEALRRRDATAAERLVATFGERAYRVAVGITGTQDDAEQAVQDSFWNVVRKIESSVPLLRIDPRPISQGGGGPHLEKDTREVSRESGPAKRSCRCGCPSTT